MIRKLLLRFLRRPVVGGLATGLVVAAVMPTVHAATTPARPETVTLRGEGSYDPYREVTTWQNALFGNGQTGLIDLHYLPVGSLQARQDYLSGNGSASDYVLSGVPFQPSELKQLKNGAKDLIDAPLFVGSMGFLLAPPNTNLGTGFGVFRTDKCDPNDPNTPDPTQCTTYYPYTGPIRVPNLLLKNYGVFGWANKSIISAWGLNLNKGSDFADPVFIPNAPPPPGSGCCPQFIIRSDPSEPDYYYQLFGAKVANPNSTPTVSEQIPNIVVTTKQGVIQEAQQLEQPRGNDGGAIAVVPPSAVQQVVAEDALQPRDHRGNPPEWIQMQNAMGQWVAPTPASITAAVTAGGDTPLYALTNKVDGAYPLVWVDHLYAPAHGLSVDKTEALATVIRYLATAGQTATTAQGDGQLPAPLVLQALNAANALVSSNCTGPGTQIVQSSDPGRYAPALPAMAKIGPMLHCNAGPSTPSSSSTSTTTTPTTTHTTSGTAPGVGSGTGTGTGTSGSISPGGGGGGSGQASGGGATSPGGSGAANTPGAAGTSRPAAGSNSVASNAGHKGSLAESTTPLPLPWGGGGLDRLTALVLGALLFWVLRKPLQCLVGNLAS